MSEHKTDKSMEDVLKISREAALRVFPYTDEGSLEDDIDAAKRNIYQHGFIEGASIQCAEKDKEIERLQKEYIDSSEEISRMGKEISKLRKGIVDSAIPNLKELFPAHVKALHQQLSTKESTIQELLSALEKNDEFLAHLEDFIHGNDGVKITEHRGEIQNLISKHKPQ